MYGFDVSLIMNTKCCDNF